MVHGYVQNAKANEYKKRTINNTMIKQECLYDESEHHASPVSLKWALPKGNRTNNESLVRWVFIRCCGQIGKVSEEGIVHSTWSCTKNRNINVADTHHSGRLILGRTTRSQVRARKPPLAVWSCCDMKIENWQASWDSKDFKIPFDFVNSGCKKGEWEERENGSESELEDEYSIRYHGVAYARVAKKRGVKHSNNKPPTYNIINGDLELMVLDIISCQNSVLTKFTDGTPLFVNMFKLWIGRLKVDDIPKIRVAKRQQMYYSIDSRRLFMYKALGIEKINVDEVEWMEEFDSKLRQNPRLLDANSHLEARFDANDYISYRNYFIHYLRSQNRCDVLKSSVYFSDVSHVVCIPVKLQGEKTRKFQFRYTWQF